jgi:hypothetical protein
MRNLSVYVNTHSVDFNTFEEDLGIKQMPSFGFFISAKKESFLPVLEPTFTYLIKS